MRADRLLSIVLLLQTRGKMTAQVLAQELEVSTRTILRDIDALSTTGIPIYAEGGHGGGIALHENYPVTVTGLREAEVHSQFVYDNANLVEEDGLRDSSPISLLKPSSALHSSHHAAV